MASRFRKPLLALLCGMLLVALAFPILLAVTEENTASTPNKVPKLNKYLVDLLRNESLLDEYVNVSVTLMDQHQNLIAHGINLEYEERISPHREAIRKIILKHREKRIKQLGLKDKTLTHEDWISIESDYTQGELQAIKSHAKEVERLLSEMRAAIKNSPEIKEKIAQTQEPLIAEVTSKYGGRLLKKGTTDNSILIEVPLKYVLELVSRPEVAFVTPVILYPNLTILDRSTYAVNADRLWSPTYPYASPTLEVAVVDTGVDVNHPSLRYRYGGTTLRDWYQIDYSWNNEGVDDLAGHGTHVAGIVGSTSSRGGG